MNNKQSSVEKSFHEVSKLNPLDKTLTPKKIAGTLIRFLSSSIKALSSPTESQHYIFTNNQTGDKTDINSSFACYINKFHQYERHRELYKVKERLVEVAGRLFQNDLIHIENKLAFLHFESKMDVSFMTLDGANSKESIIFIEIRIRAISQIFESMPYNENLMEVMLHVFYHYSEMYKRLKMYKGELLQYQEYLIELLGLQKNSYMKGKVASCLIRYSSPLALLPERELYELFTDYCQSLSDTEKDELKVLMEPKPSRIENFSLSIGRITLQDTQTRNLVTQVKFSLPLRCKVKVPTDFDSSEAGTKIQAQPINSAFADPITMKMLSFIISGISPIYYSDLIVASKDNEPFSFITIEKSGAFTPHLSLIGDGYERDSKSYEHEKITRGSVSEEYKVFASSIMAENLNKLSSLIDLDSVHDIGYNSFSNTCTEVIDINSGETIYQHLSFLTTKDSFNLAKAKYIESNNLRNYNDNYLSLRDMAFKFKPESEKSFFAFIEKSMSLILKGSIEGGSCYGYVWEGINSQKPTPKKETDIQPLVLELLKRFYEVCGIQMTREVTSANGSLDFMISYTDSSGNLMRVCVEMKLAHSKSIFDGATKQLPLYMEGFCKYGVYLVFWFKGGAASKPFLEPRKFSSPEELMSKIDDKKDNRNISTIIIDCSKPLPPSKH